MRRSVGFLSWPTLAVAVALALLVGTFVGSTFSSRRHRQRAPSVWDLVERRLREQRVRRPVAVSDAGGSG